MPVDLWHYTSHFNVPSLVNTGLIDVTGSHIHPPFNDARFPGPYVGPHATGSDPSVVWTFADDGEPDDTVRWPRGAENIWRDTDQDRGLARLALRIPDSALTTWADLAAKYNVDPKWRHDFEYSGQPERWVVVLRAVPRTEWLRVEVRSTAESAWYDVRGWRSGNWEVAPEWVPPRQIDEAAKAEFLRARARRA